MKRKVVISKTAEKKLEKLFEYLLEKWSEKIKVEFIQKLDHNIEIIRVQPEISPESKKEKKLRRCFLTKQTTLYYRFNAKRIYVVTIFDTRQNPNKLESEI